MSFRNTQRRSVLGTHKGISFPKPHPKITKSAQLITILESPPEHLSVLSQLKVKILSLSHKEKSSPLQSQEALLARVPTCTEQPQNTSGQHQTRGYLWENWTVIANVWGFQLLFSILAAFLSHPLSKVQCRKSWVPHICLSLPCT